jgi:hypothetical protein
MFVNCVWLGICHEVRTVIIPILLKDNLNISVDLYEMLFERSKRKDKA